MRPIALGKRYDADPQFRREVLERSLVNPRNGYSQKRLALYDDEHWGALPIWNPEARAILVDDRVPPSDAPAWGALEIDAVPWEQTSLIALGRRAFFQYPMQLVANVAQAMGSGERATHYGFWVHDRALGSTMWTKVPVGPPLPAVTCATCHSSVVGDELVEGRNNPDLDLERLGFEAVQDATGIDPAAFRPGRLDVTDDGIDNPTAIADLRAVRWQVNLHRAATLENGLIPLAVRIETLIITSLSEAVRPPRKLAFALALYLSQLEPRKIRAPDDAAQRGQPLFAAQCARCHIPPAFSGPAVPLEVIGTDPAVGSSPERTTGSYRVPSLRGVGDRRRLLAGGTVSDLREMLDPQRSAAGHPFGLALSAEERSDSHRLSRDALASRNRRLPPHGALSTHGAPIAWGPRRRYAPVGVSSAASRLTRRALSPLSSTPAAHANASSSTFAPRVRATHRTSPRTSAIRSWHCAKWHLAPNMNRAIKFRRCPHATPRNR